MRRRSATSPLEAAGLEVTHVQSGAGRLRFTDVGAPVYYLKAVSWSVAGFSVDTHLQTLLRLQPASSTAARN